MTRVFSLVILDSSQRTLKMYISWVRRYFFTPIFCTTAFSVVMLNNYINITNGALHDIVHRFYKGILYFQNVLALQYMLKCNAIVANKTVHPCLHRKLTNVDILHWILFQSKNNVENMDKFIYSSKWSLTFSSLIFMKLRNAYLLFRLLYISRMKV